MRILNDEEIRLNCFGVGIYWAGERQETASDSVPVLMPQFHNIAKAQYQADIKGFIELLENYDIEEECDCGMYHLDFGNLLKEIKQLVKEGE